MTDAIIVQPGPLADIAQALRAQLTLVFPEQKFSHEWMPARLTKPVWDQLIRRLPMIAVGFNKFGDVQSTAELNVVTEWSVYAITRNERGIGGVMFGDSLAPGVLQLMQVAAAVLHGHLIKDQGTAQVKDGANSFVEDFGDNTIGVAAIELTVKSSLLLRSVLTGDVLEPAQLRQRVIEWSFGVGQPVALIDDIAGNQ